nr:cytochrome P450 6a2-like [Megalopta genalis]XP_033326551.1 cytochrome P450 6a2-like [Megalopta genalis]
MMTDVEHLCGIVILAVVFYYYLIWNYDFWKKRGIPGPKPRLFFGTNKDLILARVTAGKVVQDTYIKYRNAPAIGLYDGRSPILVLHDPELIKTVLIKDFPKFAERPHRSHERTEPFTLDLFHLEMERWRRLRSKQSPMFSPGKLRGMFELMIKCSEKLEKYLDRTVSRNEVVEIRDVTTKFAADVIGSCAFGIDTNTLCPEDTEFYRLSKLVTGHSLERTVRFKLRVFLPRLYDLLGFVWPDKKLSPFFIKIVRETTSYRKKNNVYRPDFIQMLMELQESLKNQSDFEFSDTMLMAQCAAFFGAGLDTVSSTLNWTLLELALNTDIQEKLREEMKEYMEKYNGEITYETMKEMVYLNKVFQEILRKHTVAPLLLRVATSDYYFESLKFSIPKSTQIWIPLFALLRDPVVYPNPTKFDPERFTTEAVAARHPMHYIPFGSGPRNCIGSRFGTFETKLALLKILLRYKVNICEQTNLPYEYDTGAINLVYKGELYLKMTAIKQ